MLLGHARHGSILEIFQWQATSTFEDAFVGGGHIKMFKEPVHGLVGGGRTCRTFDEIEEVVTAWAAIRAANWPDRAALKTAAESA